MKKVIFILTSILLCHFLTSCGLVGPQESRNPQILEYIAVDFIKEECSLENSFASMLFGGKPLNVKIAEYYANDNEKQNNYNNEGSYVWCKKNWNKFMIIEPIDYVFNQQMQGNSYVGYFVTYSLDMSYPANEYYSQLPYYYLVQLTEFDNGRWEAEIIDKSKSLSEIQSNLY